MYKSLYDIFRHWYRTDGVHENAIWILSDPHFNDGEMMYLRKNYIGDDEQVKRINSKIGKKDTVIFLGDIGDISFIKKIRGYKVLIMGNHDRGVEYYKRKVEYEDGKIVSDNHLFDEVYEGPLIIGPKIILSHEPIASRYMLNIHGHDHSDWFRSDHPHVNLCVELIDYYPVCLKNIIESGILKEFDDIHRVTIDTATKRKADRSKPFQFIRKIFRAIFKPKRRRRNKQYVSRKRF